MRVVVHPADDTGCGRYRLRWPAEALAAQGHDVTVGPFLGDSPGVLGKVKDGDLPVLWDLEHEACDVVVVQRVTARSEYMGMRRLQEKGFAVVVDIDDDFHALERDHPAWWLNQPNWMPEREAQLRAKVRGKPTYSDMNASPGGMKMYRTPDEISDQGKHWLARACRHADLVTVTTPALAERYGGHGRVRVLPNCVPERYLRLGHIEVGRLTLGWSGSVVTHPGDLNQAKGAVQPVLDQHDAAFHVVGTGEGVQRALALTTPPTATGWLPIEDYPAALADLDVGIVPLRASEFNEAKSWLKGLEMAAVGVPFVATPTSPYRALVAEGAGWLAGTAGSWASMVGALCASTGLRAHMAGKGREVAARWTVEGRAWAWMEAWSDARDIARSRFVKVAM